MCGDGKSLGQYVIQGQLDNYLRQGVVTAAFLRNMLFKGSLIITSERERESVCGDGKSLGQYAIQGELDNHLGQGVVTASILGNMLFKGSLIITSGRVW